MARRRNEATIVTPSLRNRVLREWHQLPTREPFAPGKSATAMDALVPSVMKGLGLEKRLHESQVFYLWQQIVGDDVAHHAQPVSLRNGILVVAVDHPIWLQELQRFHKALLLQKVQERVGKKAIRDIFFRIG
jgi:hypothetical protein